MTLNECKQTLADLVYDDQNFIGVHPNGNDIYMH